MFRRLHRRLTLGLALAVCPLVFGCPPPGAADARLTRISDLEDKVEKQARQIIDKDEQLAGATQTIQTLRGLEGERRLDKLVHVAKIDAERLSGGYDDNHDGVDEGIVVYLQLIDEEGDTIKAAGAAKVRLFDANRPAGSQNVGAVELNADQMRRLWFGRLMTSHYTIKVPWSSPPPTPDRRKITVVVNFTDMLSGKTFETQFIADVSGAVAAKTP